MNLKVENINDYLEEISEDKKQALNQLRETIIENIPKGFEECISYGMIGYVVPHSIFPSGYHCNPKLPLPFASIAAQKNFIVLYHMGIYADDQILKWFTTEYPKYCSQKLDMGKSCIRFKKYDEIPFKLIGQLFHKISVEDWIETYESKIKNKLT